MTTISKDGQLVTFINVFHVEPANQQRLVEEALTFAKFEPGRYEVVEVYLPTARQNED